MPVGLLFMATSQRHCKARTSLNLHTTLLEIFNEKRELNKGDYEQVYEAIRDYLQSFSPKSMTLILDNIRPGTMEGRQREKTGSHV